MKTQKLFSVSQIIGLVLIFAVALTIATLWACNNFSHFASHIQ